jgi:hypothetical protein
VLVPRARSESVAGQFFKTAARAQRQPRHHPRFASGATVHLRTVLPEGATVPLGWIAVGDPAEILPPYEHERIWAIQKARSIFRVTSSGSIGRRRINRSCHR